MAKKKEFNPEDIHLVQVGNFKSVIDIDFDLKKLIKQFHGYHFCFSQKTGLSVKSEAVRIRLNVDITARNKKKEELSANYEFGLEFHFQIDDFESYISYDDDNIPQIDQILGHSMLGICYSTARGIIYAKTEVSVLSGILLPVIDPAVLMKDSHEIMIMDD